ncbi:hypothetical protein ACSBR1_033877 [Camellia fascicularis]
MKPLEHEDLMREVFTSATVTGKHHWTPDEKAIDIGDGESNSVDSARLQPSVKPYKSVFNTPPNSPNVDIKGDR